MGKALKIALPLLALAIVIAGAGYAYSTLSAGREAPGLATPPPATEGTTGPDAPGTDTTAQAAPKLLAAADFTCYDAQGEPVRLADQWGKPVVLNFWASWCGPCKTEMPDFQTVAGELGEAVTFMMVNLTDGQGETVETAKAFLKENGYDLDVYFDSDMAGAYAYGVNAIPITFVFDRNGYLAGYQPGMLSEAGLRRAIELAFEQEAETDGLAPAHVPTVQYEQGTVTLGDLVSLHPCAEPGLTANTYAIPDSGQGPQAAAELLMEHMACTMMDLNWAFTRTFTIIDFRDITVELYTPENADSHDWSIPEGFTGEEQWLYIPDYSIQFTGTVSPAGTLPKGEWMSMQSDGTPGTFVLERRDGQWITWSLDGQSRPLKPTP